MDTETPGRRGGGGRDLIVGGAGWAAAQDSPRPPSRTRARRPRTTAPAVPPAIPRRTPTAHRPRVHRRRVDRRRPGRPEDCPDKADGQGHGGGRSGGSRATRSPTPTPTRAPTPRPRRSTPSPPPDPPGDRRTRAGRLPSQAHHHMCRVPAIGPVAIPRTWQTRGPMPLASSIPRWWQARVGRPTSAGRTAHLRMVSDTLPSLRGGELEEWCPTCPCRWGSESGGW